MSLCRVQVATGGLTVLLALAGGCGSSERETTTTAVPSEAALPLADPTEIRRQPGLDILLITIDTLRADALGSYGNPIAETPWMDRLAEGGVRFENARAHNVTTLPSHATILSGLHPQQHGIRDNSGFRFPEQVETLATLLSARGYRTGAFVSAFPLDSRFGLDSGFDVYEDSFVGVENRQAFFEQERAASKTIALARQWLDVDDQRPTFAWVHLYEPHYPYAPPEHLATRFRNDPYLGDVAAADAALGDLLAPILNDGDDTDTLVILTSDHGESLGEHGEATHGIFGYEGALRVPLILHHPRLLPVRIVPDPARLVDILPTTLDLLDLPIPSRVAGRSLLPSATGHRRRDSLETYFEALSGQLNRGWAPLFGVVQDNWKYIELPIPELYDLGNDPKEQVNLARSATQRATELHELLRSLRSGDTGADPSPENLETQKRLRSLGYLSGSGPPRKQSYGEGDDPKQLIVLDAALREITGLYADGDLAAARTRCQELVRRRPGMRVVLMTLAQIERDLGDFDAAVEAMREAYELNPDDATTLALLASYLTQAGRAEEAVNLTATHVRQMKPDLDVLLARGLILARLQRPREALDMLEQARQLDPENPQVSVYLGTFYLMGGQREQARAAYEEALALNPGAIQAHTSLAIMATEENRIDEALAHWRQAIALDTRQHSTLSDLGSRLWRAGQREQARPLLELFIDSAPAEEYADEIGRIRDLLAADG